MDLIQILKNVPKGTLLYSPIMGIVVLEYIDDHGTDFPIVVRKKDTNIKYCFSSKGTYTDAKYAECLLFPARDNRDWSTLKPDLPMGTPVVVGNSKKELYNIRFYASKHNAFVLGATPTKKNLEETISWEITIPFDKFNPLDIEESLKHKL